MQWEDGHSLPRLTPVPFRYLVRNVLGIAVFGSAALLIAVLIIAEAIWRQANPPSIEQTRLATTHRGAAPSRVSPSGAVRPREAAQAPAAVSTDPAPVAAASAPASAAGSGSRSVIPATSAPGNAAAVDAAVLDPAAQEALRQGRSLLDQGQFARAGASFQRAIRLEPGSGIAHDYLGIAFLRQRRYTEAIDQFQNEIRIGQEPGYGWARMADVYTEEGNTREAMRALERAVAFRPDLAQLELNLALLYQQALDLRRSLQALDRCVALDPSNSYAHYLRGNLLYKLGMLSQAEQELQTAIRLDPQTGIYHFALAQVLLRHQPSPQNRERARNQLESALSLGMGEPAEAHYWLGLCYSGQGEWEKARRELQQSVALAPNAWAAYYALREALLHLGRIPEAREAEARFQVLRKAEDARMKRQFFVQEIQRNPGSVQAHLQYAEYLAANGDAAQARQELETIRRMVGKHPLAPEIARRIRNLLAGGPSARSSG